MDPHDRAVLDAVAEYSDHPSAFIGCNDSTSHFMTPRIPGTVAYRRRGRSVCVLGGPITDDANRADLLDAFTAEVAGRRRIVVAQIRATDVDWYARRDFSVNQLGSSYSIDLAEFTDRGKRLAKVRQNVNRAARDGVRVREITGDPPPELDDIDRRWLRAKGWYVRKLDFMVGQRAGRGAARRRLFVAEHEQRVVGYISYSPAYGARPGWLYDLTRRLPTAPVGSIELINLTALHQFRAEGAGWLHLGLTPFAGLGADDHPAASPLVRRTIRALAGHGSFAYQARTQERFKLKWAPHVVEPEFLGFADGPSVGALWQLAQITNSI